VLVVGAITVGMRAGQAPETRPMVGSVRASDEPRTEVEPAPPRQVRIGVHTDPPDARVFLDELPVVNGAVTLSWRSEPRMLRVSAPGYRAVERAVDSTLDREVSVTLERERRSVLDDDVEPPRRPDRTERPERTDRPERPERPAKNLVRPTPIPTPTPERPPSRPAPGLVAPVQEL